MFLVDWYRSLNLRWKIQLSFLLVTVLTTVYNRWLASVELEHIIKMVHDNKVSAQIVQQLQRNYTNYLSNSVYESVIELVVLFFVIAILARFFTKPIEALCNALRRVEDGDLTKEVANHSKDEIGILERSFNSMVNRLNQMMGQLNRYGKQLNQSANQIATISDEINNVSNEEQQRTVDVSKAASQLHALSQSVQSLADEATIRANTMKDDTICGISNLQDNIEAMQNTANDVNRASEQLSELQSAAEEIHDIIGTINAIAEQTNLLSLNAAIEAARAGEQGRGFAVVADEVRALANSTSQSANKISSIIDSLSSKVNRVTETMDTVVEQVNNNNENTNNTATLIKSIAEQIHLSANSNDQILDACKDQLNQFTDLQSNMEVLFATLNDSSSKVKTTARIGQGLLEMTKQMNELIGDFQYDENKLADEDNEVAIEKRQAPRAKNTLFVKVRKGDHRIEGISQDISVTGMQLHLPDSLESEQTVIDLFIPHDDYEVYRNQQPLRLRGKAVWHKKFDDSANPYVYGIQFIEVSQHEKDKILECFRYFNKKAA